MQVAAAEVKQEIDFPGRVVKSFDYFDDLPRTEFRDLKEPVYEFGSGLDNGDELEDQREQARLAEEAAERERIEERQRREEARRKLELEAARKKEEEERQRRLRQTREERLRIQAYLAELKEKKRISRELLMEENRRREVEQARRLEAQKRADEEAVQKQEEEELLRKAVEAEELAMRKQAERGNEFSELCLMKLEDLQSREFRLSSAEFEAKLEAEMEMLRLIYTPHQPMFSKGEEEEGKTRRSAPQAHAPSTPERDAAHFAYGGRSPDDEMNLIIDTIRRERSLKRAASRGKYTLPQHLHLTEDVSSHAFSHTNLSNAYLKHLGFNNRAASTIRPKTVTTGEIISAQRALRSYNGLTDLVADCVPVGAHVESAGSRTPQSVPRRRPGRGRAPENPRPWTSGRERGGRSLSPNMPARSVSTLASSTDGIEADVAETGKGFTRHILKPQYGVLGFVKDLNERPGSRFPEQAAK